MQLNNWKKILSQLESPEPPAEFFENIIYQIKLKQRRLIIIAKWKAALLSALAIGSLTAIIVAINLLEKEIAQTNFFQYLSLMFSDFSTTIYYWQSFIMSLLETLPIISFISVLISLLVLLESLKYLTKNVKLILLQTKYN